MPAAICHTPGCTNAGVAVEVPATALDADGRPAPITSVVCGPCGNPIEVEGLTDTDAPAR